MLESKTHLVVYLPLTNLEATLGFWRGKWTQSIQVLRTTEIIDLIGIWGLSEPGSFVYALRKHPALSMLTSEEAGQRTGGDNEEDSDEEED